MAMKEKFTMGKLARKIKFGAKAPSPLEEVRQYMLHQEKQALRRGKETFEEANDFDVPDLTCPLDHYFDQPTRSERYYNQTLYIKQQREIKAEADANQDAGEADLQSPADDIQ